MTRRYYVSDLPIDGGTITLAGAEAHHATNVMRVEIGESIELFDGKGNQSSAVIAQVGRREVRCDAQASEAVDREPSRAIHLAIALPKPDRARELIERLTELGVKSVTPLIAGRTQRPPSESLIEKLSRGVIEACKQSGRNELLRIMPAQRATDFFAADHPAVRFIAHPSTGSQRLSDFQNANEVIAAIGPEGGWTGEEVQCATDHGFQCIDLGRRTYRIETAATVVASLLVQGNV